MWVNGAMAGQTRRYSEIKSIGKRNKASPSVTITLAMLVISFNLPPYHPSIPPSPSPSTAAAAAAFAAAAATSAASRRRRSSSALCRSMSLLLSRASSATLSRPRRVMKAAICGTCGRCVWEVITMVCHA